MAWWIPFNTTSGSIILYSLFNSMLLKVFINLFSHLLQQGVCYDAFLWKSSAVYDECLPLWLFTFPASVNLDIDLITTCSKISTIQPHLISIWYWSQNYPFQNKRHTTLFEEQHHLMKAIWLFIVSAFFQVSYRSFSTYLWIGSFHFVLAFIKRRFHNSHNFWSHLMESCN